MISVVIPVYNVEKYLPETLDSVINQSYTDWELIPVDDASTDGSRSILMEYEKKDARIRPIYLDENKGAWNARNAGIDKAQGQYIAFLDGDDVWNAGKLESQLAFLQEKKAGFTFTGYEFADEKAMPTGKVVRVPATITYKEALKNTTIFTSTVMFDTLLIDKALIHMPHIKSEDTATWWQILRTGVTGYGLDESLTLYRRISGSLSANKLEAIRRIWILYRKAEKLSVAYSIYNFIFYAFRAVKRRV